MTERRRKAWAVWPNWASERDVFFAPTAGKAKYQALLDWRDCFPDLTLMELRARRWPERDVVLPPPHWLLSDLTPQERHVIAHAFGADSRSPGYREHYCTAPGDRRILRLVYELGIFSGPHSDRDEYAASSGWAGAFFYLTALGKHVALSMLPDYPR